MNHIVISKDGVYNLWNQYKSTILNSSFSSTSVADANGKLLFASDGDIVMNGDMEPLATGLGGVSTVLSAPLPEDPSKHYIFYSSLSNNTYNLKYAVVDTKLNGGKGRVITANQLIDTALSRGFTLSIVPGSKEFWIVAHKYKTGNFRAFKVTPAGISTTSVESNAGSNPDKSAYSFHHLRTSPNGLMIGGFSAPGDFLVTSVSPGGETFLEVFNFDPASGSLSSKIKSIPKQEQLTTNSSVEFSADNRLVYVCKNIFLPNITSCEVKTSQVLQFNLCYTDPSDFTKYAIDVAELNSWCNGSKLVSLQMGADRKIHMSLMGQTNLASIDFPNRIGMSSHSDVFAHRTPNSLSEGSSSFNHYYVEKAVKNNILYTGKCFPEPVSFSISNNTIASANWNFGDPASGSNSTVSLNPQHIFSAPGIYTVSADLFDAGGDLIETIYEVVEMKDPNQRLLHQYPTDTTLCEGDFINIKVNVVNGIFHWYMKDVGGQPVKEITANNYWTKYPGVIYVEMRQNDCDGCILRDSINVKFVPRPVIDLGDTLGLCKGDSILLSVRDNADSYLWSTGDDTKSIWAKEAGMYWVKVVQTLGCTLLDTVDILTTPVTEYSLPADTILCEGKRLTLHANVPNARVVWNDNVPGNSLEIQQAGNYWVKLTDDDGCSNADTIIVAYNQIPRIDLGKDTVLKEGETLLLGGEIPDAEYIWQNGNKTPQLLVTEPGLYWLRLDRSGCTFADSIKVDYYFSPSRFTLPNAFTPNNDGKNDVLGLKSHLFIKKFKLVVFNRWGQRVFTSTDPSFRWDGTLNGMPQPAGNYLWQMTLTDTKGVLYNKKGSVILIR